MACQPASCQLASQPVCLLACPPACPPARLLACLPACLPVCQSASQRCAAAVRFLLLSSPPVFPCSQRFSAVAGGKDNTVGGAYSFAAGFAASVPHAYAAVLGFNSGVACPSSGDNTVSVCATGGLFLNGEAQQPSSVIEATIAALQATYDSAVAELRARNVALEARVVAMESCSPCALTTTTTAATTTTSAPLVPLLSLGPITSLSDVAAWTFVFAPTATVNSLSFRSDGPSVRMKGGNNEGTNTLSIVVPGSSACVR